jgi:hypothetical protein
MNHLRLQLSQRRVEQLYEWARQKGIYPDQPLSDSLWAEAQNEMAVLRAAHHMALEAKHGAP